MSELNRVIAMIRHYHPGVQAIYLFGSFETPNARPESDEERRGIVEAILETGRIIR